MVLANALGQRLLSGALRGSDLPADFQLIINEGETDFLSSATLWSLDEQASSTAVFGIWSGAWTDAIAMSVPDGAPIYIRTDQDAKGDEYARRIGRDLMGRCRLFRTRPITPAEDDCDG